MTLASGAVADAPSLSTSRGGLSAAEVAQRREQFGPNTIERKKQSSPFKVLLEQFSSPVVLLLLGAAAISALIGELADGVAIAAIVALNAVVGFVQDYRAERSIAALRSLTAPRASVVRDGHTSVIPANEVVPGDLLLFEAGDIVAADATLLESNALTVNEAALTGESEPVRKSTEPCAPDAPLAEQHNRVFLGTPVLNGGGRALASETGMRTELGKIARLIETAEQPVTPLEQQLAQLSRLLLFACLAIVGVVAGLGLFRGQSAFDVFLSATSLAVAAVPEGLPAVVTIALAIGVQRMARRNVLVRRLPAVETLGSVTVICSDKTGTLTRGVMVLRELQGPDPLRLLDAAAACSDAELQSGGEHGLGDPTELAILVEARARGIERAEIERERPRVNVAPFDPVRKRMSIERADGTLYVKGAAESVLPLCVTRDPELEEQAAAMAARGLRVLAVAVGKGPEEAQLKLLGFVGIADPPRPEAIEAVRVARGAGIATVMITGDHPATARAIARELGISSENDGQPEVVYARATPNDKLEIVRRWKSRGAIVAMTGDGVNDAPALREAHVGIAMGKGGTEVTREASDIVLADDNFASIVAGVAEGRGVFLNIRKALVYLLAGNTGELLVMLIAAMVGLPLPLLPLHLLWINLMTDGFPALALVMDAADPDALQQPPRDPRQPILGRVEWRMILLEGCTQAGLSLGVFIWALQSRDVSEARNLAFSTLVFGEVLRAFGARSATRTFWELPTRSHARLLGVAVVTVALQLAIHHFSAARALFQLEALSLPDCMLTLTLGLVPLVLKESLKLATRNEGPRSA